MTDKFDFRPVINQDIETLKRAEEKKKENEEKDILLEELKLKTSILEVSVATLTAELHNLKNQLKEMKK